MSTPVWADLTTLDLPDELRHSYSLALTDAVKTGKLNGFIGEEIAVGELHLPSIVVEQNAAFQAWHTATLAMFSQMTLPSVASVANLTALPYFTPTLLPYLRRERSKTVPKRKAGTAKAAAEKPEQPVPTTSSASV